MGVKLRQQRLAAFHPLDAEPRRQRQAVVDLESLAVGVLANLPGIVPRPQKPGVLAGPDERSFHQERGQRHSAGNAVAAGTNGIKPRSVAGIVVARGDLVEKGTGLGVAGQELMGCIEVVREGVRRASERSPAYPARAASSGRCSQMWMPGTGSR